MACWSRWRMVIWGSTVEVFSQLWWEESILVTVDSLISGTTVHGFRAGERLSVMLPVLLSTVMNGCWWPCQCTNHHSCLSDDSVTWSWSDYQGATSAFITLVKLACFEGWEMNSTSIQGLDASEGTQCPHHVTHRAFCGESLLYFTLSQQKRLSAWQVCSLMLKTIFTILKHAIPSHLWSLYQGCWFWIWTRKREGRLRSSGCRKNKPLSLTLDLMGSQIHYPQYLW